MEKVFWDRFLDFEKENHLFDLQDKYGTYYFCGKEEGYLLLKKELLKILS